MKERMETPFFNPFPQAVIEAGRQVMGKFIPLGRDPELVVQDTLLRTGFWPAEPEARLLGRLGLLDRAMQMDQGGICGFMAESRSAVPVTGASRKMSDDLLAYVDNDLELYTTGHPAELVELRSKLAAGQTKELSPREKAILFRIKAEYSRRITEGIGNMLSSLEPVEIEPTIIRQFRPRSPVSAEYVADPDSLQYDTDRIAKMDADNLPILTHGLTEKYLKRQIFHGMLGSAPGLNILSFAMGRIFEPRRSKIEDPCWVLFMDPQKARCAGMIIMPDLKHSAKSGENEVYVMPPADFSLFMAAAPLEMLKNEFGWKFALDSMQMWSIPKELHNPENMAAFLAENRTAIEAFGNVI